MATKLFLFAFLLSTSVAQSTTTLTLPLYGFDPSQSIAASVIAASSGNATSLFLDCIPSPSNPEACAGFAYSRTLVTGPSTYRLEVHEPDLSVTSTQDCKTVETAAVCEEYATSGDSYHYDGVNTYPLAMISSFDIAVTAGVGKLAQVEATRTSESMGNAMETGMSGSAPEMTSSMVTATMTSEAAASGTSTGAAVATSIGKEMGVIAAVCGVACLWL